MKPIRDGWVIVIVNISLFSDVWHKICVALKSGAIVMVANSYGCCVAHWYARTLVAERNLITGCVRHIHNWFPRRWCVNLTEKCNSVANMDFIGCQVVPTVGYSFCSEIPYKLPFKIYYNCIDWKLSFTDSNLKYLYYSK